MEVFHNVLDIEQLACLESILQRNKWTFTGSSSGDMARRFWNMDLSHESFFMTMLIKLENLTNKRFELYRVYANGHTFGMNGDCHTDSESSDDFTIVYYYNPTVTNQTELNNFGGYTLFKFDNTIYCNEPVHNSFVAFPSDILHRGLGPFQRENGLRITIAFKLKVVEGK